MTPYDKAKLAHLRAVVKLLDRRVLESMAQVERDKQARDAAWRELMKLKSSIGKSGK